MVRLSSSARRTALRSGIRSRRNVPVREAETQAGANPDTLHDAPYDDPAARLKRKRRRQVRDMLRSRGRRSGFGKALRKIMRAASRASIKRKTGYLAKRRAHGIFVPTLPSAALRARADRQRLR